LVQSIFSGITLGGLYAVFGIGISLIWGVMSVCNFAHGALAFLGAYFAFTLFRAYGIGPIESLLFIVPLFFLIGLCIQKVLIEKAARRIEYGVEFELVTIVITFGFGLILESLMNFIWTTLPKTIEVTYLGRKAFELGAVRLPTNDILALVMATTTVVLLVLLLVKTNLGLGIRATSQDRVAAQLVGIDVGRISLISFGISSALAAAAGVTMSLSFPFDPAGSLIWGVRAFIVVVLGGVGSIWGTLAGALILGLSECVAGAVLPFAFRSVTALAIFIIVLLFKPEGLFRRA
jgi:branched-chain amino acid transport system permease protein